MKIEEWTKEFKQKLEEYEKKHGKEKEVEKIPVVLKRCPKCFNLSLEYDPKTGRIYCTKCGFEAYIPKTK